MKKLYKVRLFRLLMDPIVSSKYEVYTVGSVIVSKKKNNCKEFMYGVNIPIVDVEIDRDGLAFLTEEEAKVGYAVLKDDFNEKNILKTQKDLIKFNFDTYAEMTMKLIQFEKNLNTEEKGVMYGKSIRRGKK